MTATAALGARPSDVRACREVIRRHGRSFAFAARFLPADVRADVAVLYAYYRTVDDLVDAPPPGLGPAGVRAALDEWEAWLSAGAPWDASHPVRRALPGVIERRGIDRTELAIVVRGQRADLAHLRPRTMADLDAYAFDVAGSVGLVMATVLGARSPEQARPAAARLGTAMQLTNICRDVAEDLDRGRVYLPVDVCAATGCTDRMLYARRAEPEVRAAVAVVGAHARQRYEEGLTGLALLPREARFPIALAARAYGAILDRLRDRQYDVFGGRVSTTRRAKWGMAARLAASRVAGR